MFAPSLPPHIRHCYMCEEKNKSKWKRRDIKQTKEKEGLPRVQIIRKTNKVCRSCRLLIKMNLQFTDQHQKWCIKGDSLIAWRPYAPPWYQGTGEGEGITQLFCSLVLATPPHLFTSFPKKITTFSKTQLGCQHDNLVNNLLGVLQCDPPPPPSLS